MVVSVDPPEIFLLSLAHLDFFDTTYADLIASLEESADVKQAKKISGAMKYLDSNDPDAILVTDGALTENEHRAVLEKVIAYTRNGGLVIAGFHLPSFAQWKDIDAFFGAFGLPWKTGNYTSGTFEFKTSSELPPSSKTTSFPAKKWHMKALHVMGARSHEKIVMPEEEEDDEDGYSDEEERERINKLRRESEIQAAVAGANVGNGYLVYAGDVNPGKELNQVILALCGLQIESGLEI